MYICFFGFNYSPMVRKRRSTNAYEYDFDPQSIKRAQRVQEVRLINLVGIYIYTLI
jgi:hypothetical protein